MYILSHNSSYKFFFSQIYGRNKFFGRAIRRKEYLLFFVIAFLRLK